MRNTMETTRETVSWGIFRYQLIVSKGETQMPAPLRSYPLTCGVKPVRLVILTGVRKKR